MKLIIQQRLTWNTLQTQHILLPIPLILCNMILVCSEFISLLVDSKIQRLIHWISELHWFLYHWSTYSELMNTVKRKNILLNWVSLNSSFIIRFVYSIQKSMISINSFLLMSLSLSPIKCIHFSFMLSSLCNYEKVNDTMWWGFTSDNIWFNCMFHYNCIKENQIFFSLLQ